jgi:hypothetical protein
VSEFARASFEQRGERMRTAVFRRRPDQPEEATEIDSKEEHPP